MSDVESIRSRKVRDACWRPSASLPAKGMAAGGMLAIVGKVEHGAYWIGIGGESLVPRKSLDGYYFIACAWRFLLFYSLRIAYPWAAFYLTQMYPAAPSIRST